jgi:hypothetical protein
VRWHSGWAHAEENVRRCAPDVDTCRGVAPQPGTVSDASLLQRSTQDRHRSRTVPGMEVFVGLLIVILCAFAAYCLFLSVNAGGD